MGDVKKHLKSRINSEPIMVKGEKTLFKLYLDPGHGGTDSGAIGNGLQEKDLTLDIALRIRTLLLNNYENVDVNMSRETDVFVSLAERTNAANNWQADYFLSIHINSADSSSANGYEDYIYQPF